MNVKNKNILFPSIWHVYEYRMLWKYHYKDKSDVEINKRWKTEMEEMVLKVYYYEKYNRIMQGEKVDYYHAYEIYKYFKKIDNEKAVSNIAFLLKSFDELKNHINRLVKNENYKLAEFFNNFFELKLKPELYLIEFDEIFITEKQNIIKDIKYLQKEHKTRNHEITYTNDLLIEMREDNPKYILLGTFNNPSCIAETLQIIQNNKELLKLLIWAIHSSYKNHIPEIKHNLENTDSNNLINYINNFNNDTSIKIELQYFTKVAQLIKEHNKVDKKLLVNTLKYFNKNNIQHDILKQVDKQILLESLDHANEIEEYELSQLLYKYIYR